MRSSSSSSSSLNGEGFSLPVRAKPSASYPDARRAGGFIFVSGASSRLPGGKGFLGAQATPWGPKYDVEAQTAAVLQNIARALKLCGASLQNVVQTNCFLVDMRDMAAFNRAYGSVFDAQTGPVRTTVAVHQLPHPDIRVEINCVAIDPDFAARSKL